MRKIFLLGALFLAGCSLHFGSMHASYVDATSGSTCVTTLGRDRLGIASYRDGALHGAEIGFEPSAGWVRDWADGRELVDHPSLPAWRSQFARMQEAATDPGEDPAVVAAASRGFPFEEACRDVCRTWVAGSPRRAGLLLDRFEVGDLGHTSAAEFAQLALQEPNADERLARWFQAFTGADHRDAALLVVRSGPVGPVTGRAVLQQLDDFPSALRADLFEAAAASQVGDGVAAGRIQRSLADLPSNARAEAAVELLGHDGCSREFAIQLLRELDDFRSADRDSVFLAAARVLQGDGTAGVDVAAAVDDLPYDQRFAVVRAALALPGGAAFAADLLRVTDDLPSRDRVAFLDQVLLLEPWQSTLGAAFRAAVHDVGRSSERERLLRDLEARERGAMIR